MPWKSEIDRIVGRALNDALKAGGNEAERAVRAALDMVEMAPDREASHFHLGSIEELMESHAANLPQSTGQAERWRHLGRLDAAARRGQRDRIHALIESELFDETIEQPEGRVALRAISRPLLREGEDQRVFDWYARHLRATNDDQSRRDAEFLLEEALRRADRYERGERDEEEVLTRLARAAKFVKDAGLDPRSGAKVGRKMGRVHQVAGRWTEAADCYREALEALAADDSYRSVLVGDLALATLGVRGTLDLLPETERPGRDEALAILEAEPTEAEGRSYNAIYTMAMLRYESGDFAGAAQAFGEADELMRENRAKARIVHARSRFFRSHCQLKLGAEGEALEEARRLIQKETGPSNLPVAVKDAVLADLGVSPADDGRGGRRGRRGRGRGRGERAPDSAPSGSDEAAAALTSAQAALADDPRAALDFVDRAFRSRPDFDTWVGAYRVRLEALLALEAIDEARRTYDRFRAKLFQGEAFDQVERLLKEEDGPLVEILDDADLALERADLFEVMPGREADFARSALDAAAACLARGAAGDAARAVALARSAQTRGAEGADAMLGRALTAATAAGEAEAPPPSLDETRELLGKDEEPLRLLVVGGDEGRRPHLARFEALQGDLGFRGSWIFTSARSPQQAMQDIQKVATSADAMLLHPRTEPELREAVLKLAASLDVPVRQAAWLGADGVESEVLRTLDRCFEEE